MKRKECCSPKTLKKKIQTGNIFQGIYFYILPARFGPHRLSLFKENINKFGGICQTAVKNEFESTIHVLLEESINKEVLLKICDIHKWCDAKFIKCSWLSKCLRQNAFLPIGEEELIYETLKKRNIVAKTNPSEVPDKIEASSNESNRPNLNANSNPMKTPINIPTSHTEKLTTEDFKSKFYEKFACAHASSSAPANPNEHIIEKLKKLASVYETRNDTWRTLGYQRAISAIKNYPQKIETWEEARSIRGVGDRLADKIKEILESGKLQKVQELCESEESKTLQLFLGVWGAGPTTAKCWYTQGLRTLDDLKEKALLNNHQKIGLKYYDELNERMLRQEVKDIELQVRSAAEAVMSGLILTVCGSFRRGKSSCGDVDILVTHPDGNSHLGLFQSLLRKLKENDFLTDDLVIQENNGNQQKYLGVCKLPGEGHKHRRLDIIVVPFDEMAPALLYFTGSAHFNRSMRLLATKLGMTLSEHGLKIRSPNNEKFMSGTRLDTPTEESIFNYLNLPYRPPSERDH